MLDSAKEAIEFATGKSRSDLDDDRKLVLAIIKSIEIIGEAASKVSKTCKAVLCKFKISEKITVEN
jgi:uncharacterized protein with HEPN domain